MNNQLEQIKSVMFGHAVGDALGVPVEFCEREELDEDPVTTMTGWGVYSVPEGCWSDDTSMSLATLDSLKKGSIDYEDIMENFVAWCTRDEYTPTGEMFDIGKTCMTAIRNYIASDGKPALECGLTDAKSNGNGSLMRIHPMALYLFSKGITGEKGIEIIHNTSALTHAHPRAKIACGIYSLILWEILKRPCKASVLDGMRLARRIYGGSNMFSTSKDYFIYDKFLMKRIGGIYRHGEDEIQEVTRDEIKNSGYVVDTLEAAIWCVLTTKDYKECVLKAVNLGGDTDTIAAVAGGLAGALYGIDSIPAAWLKALKKRDYIDKMCLDAYSNWKKQS